MIGLLNTDKKAHWCLLFLIADINILVVMLVFSPLPWFKPWTFNPLAHWYLLMHQLVPKCTSYPIGRLILTNIGSIMLSWQLRDLVMVISKHSEKPLLKLAVKREKPNH